MTTPTEPVAWLYESENGGRELVFDCNSEYASRLLQLGYTEQPLFAADRIQTLEAALAAEREACAKVCDAGRALVAKLDECQPHIEAATMFQFTHGIEYTGPQYGEELVALRAAIRARSIQDRVG